jgi:hypothetical protein
MKVKMDAFSTSAADGGEWAGHEHTSIQTYSKDKILLLTGVNRAELKVLANKPILVHFQQFH